MLEQALLDLDASRVAADESDVLIVVQSGLAPARDSIRLPLPIPINGNLVITPLSFPVIKADTSTATFAQIGVDGQQQNIPPRKMIGEFIHGECPYTFLEQAAKKQMRSR